MATTPRRVDSQPRISLRRGLVVAGAAGALVARIGRAQTGAESFPGRPVHLVVPYPPGGSPDLFARAIGTRLALALRQPVVVENRAGGGGTIGASHVARAPADGYTLLMGHIGTLAVNPSLFPKLPYDPIAGFAPVAQVANVANVLVVHPDIRASGVRELIALARAQPDRLMYASGGNGGAAHIAMESFKQRAGVRITHVPYKGTAQAITDLIAGQVAMTLTGAPPLMPHIQAGRVKALAVSSARRIEALAHLPTIAESGLEGFEATQWYGVVAPAGTPRPIIERLNREIRAILATPALIEQMRQEGALPAAGTPEAFGDFIRLETVRWGALIRSAGIQAD